MKTIRISAALLAAVILCMSLAACGGALKGTYKAESFGTGASYTFSGKKVTVDILVLGAFGCGAFANDPKIVAKAYHEALIGYRSRFDVIEFAIYCSPGHEENYDAFSKELAML